MARLSGMARRTFPVKYLGVPLFIGRPRVLHFEFLVEKISTIIEGWKARLLSFGGKLTLIKSVLHSIPIYSMASTMVPSSVIKRIERLMANFLWSSKAETRTQLVKWERICLNVDAGGLELEVLANSKQLYMASSCGW